MSTWKAGLVVAALVAVLGSVLASPAFADGVLVSPIASPAGTYGGIRYLQYDGVFEGSTSTGDYRVPYRITAPADPQKSNGTAVVEPPHAVTGLEVLHAFLGRSFLLGRGFIHSGVGYSTTKHGSDARLRILDPDRSGVFIKGGFQDGNGRTDDEIITDFARALSGDPVARSLVGRVARRYLMGFSDSSAPVLRLVASGRAGGVFDLAFPFIAEPTVIQPALTNGGYAGKLMIVNSEFEGASAAFVDRGVVPRRYRFYAVAGTPHIPDLFTTGPWNMTTPASYQPELRAHFLQAERWVNQDIQPAPSTHLVASTDGTLQRDANGNAVAAASGGQRVPRLPFVELGEARFITGFLGSYDDAKTIAELGFSSYGDYLKAFGGKLAAYIKAYDIPTEDADAMRKRAELCPPLTFTQTYRDHYDEFAAIRPCVN